MCNIKAVLIHNVGVDDAAVTVLFGVTVTVPDIVAAVQGVV
jgi:phage tail protein X